MSGAIPSMLPNPPREPLYVVRMRSKVRELLEALRAEKRANATLRRELIQARARMGRKGLRET